MQEEEYLDIGPHGEIVSVPVQFLLDYAERLRQREVLEDLRSAFRCVITLGEMVGQLEGVVKRLGRRPPVQSPWLNAEQAAAYLGISVKALYGLVERGKLPRPPGHRKYRFTREQLDAYLRGEKA